MRAGNCREGAFVQRGLFDVRMWIVGTILNLKVRGNERGGAGGDSSSPSVSGDIPLCECVCVRLCARICVHVCMMCMCA